MREYKATIQGERTLLKQSNRIDLDYIYYLPFCMVFCSGDKLHEKLAPVFLDSDQTFVTRDELKADLASIIEYWKVLSEGERTERSRELDSYPPEVESSFTHQMWKKYMRPRDSSKTGQLSSEQLEVLVREMKPLIEAISKLKSGSN